MIKTLSSATAVRLRHFFETSGYTDVVLRKRPAFHEQPTLRSGTLPYQLYETSEPTALNVLLRLFLLGVPVPLPALRQAFPADILGIVADAGLLVPDCHDQVKGSVMLTPLDPYWFAADPNSMADAPDFVLWANPTTRALLQHCVRRHVADTCDLGAGCGVLSVFAREFSDRVVATDLNQRAEAYVHFNAALNSVDGIETYTGDTFEPLGEQSFDLIMANPPFFVTPTQGLMYCENSMELDGYCRRVAREGAARLKEGGFLQMTCEWVQLTGQPWAERLAEWFEGTGCDAWVMRSYQGDPASYAFQRVREDYPKDPAAAKRKFDSWMAYYCERGVEQICGGLVTMRKRSGKNWLRMEEVPLGETNQQGDAILEIFETQTVLSSLAGDAELARLKPRLVSLARLEQVSSAHDGRWAPTSLKLVLHGGLPQSIAVELPVAGFLARCDGQKTLEEIARGISAEVRVPAEAVLSQCISVVRRLAERRFLAL